MKWYKTLRWGAGCLVSVSAATAKAVEWAHQHQLQLIGFARPDARCGNTRTFHANDFEGKNAIHGITTANTTTEQRAEARGVDQNGQSNQPSFEANGAPEEMGQQALAHIEAFGARDVRR